MTQVYLSPPLSPPTSTLTLSLSLLGSTTVGGPPPADLAATVSGDHPENHHRPRPNSERQLTYINSLTSLIFQPLLCHQVIIPLPEIGEEISVSVATKITMGPRWKGKAAKAKALEQPMSKTISELQSSLTQSNSEGLLSGSTVLLEADSQQTRLLNLACFGRPILTPQSDKQWFQLDLEEAFFLHHSLGCLRILTPVNGLWHYMCSKVESFPELYKAYSHLRANNWLVRPGSQYGVNYVAYRHHPALVHSEFAVLVVSDGASGRLQVWSDFHCTLRLCGSVSKTLLVMNILSNNGFDADFPACLDEFRIVERSFTRWNPQRCREERTDAEDCVV